MISVLIPARNEFLLRRTIESILESAEGEIEIIAVLDGYWPEPNIIDEPRVTLIHHTEPVGQRRAVNEAARMAKGKYILKTDGHSMFDKGFDVKLAADCEYDWTVIPRMYNLHAFDWVCEDGHRIYQDKFPPEGGECKECGKPVKIDWVWKPRLHKKTDFMYMDKDLKVQYWYKYAKRPESKGDIVDIMNGVGACWFQHKDRFFELGGLDEKHGSWGQVGAEVGCKAWLSGGRHVVNRKTWFAHMFRTTKEFTFPYQIKVKDQNRARKYSQDLWTNDKWPLQKRPFKWMLEKFQPIPTWELVKLTKELDLSVIIPARNEKYLQRTVDDCLAKLKTNFEIIVGADSYDPKLKEDPRVVVYRSEKRIGMRPMINKMSQIARGKYLMKLDAHCIVDEGVDKKLIESHEPGSTVIAVRYELDSERWKRREKTDCPYRYISHPDADPKGGLRGLAWPQWAKLHKDDQIGETMTISGSIWLMAKKQFLDWGGLDEKHGTFGQEGVEIACMTWLSGGRVLVNKNTWYAHWNRGRTSYSLGSSEKPKSMKRSIELWMGDNWPLAKRKFQWLIDKFSPVPGWDNQLTIVTYTDGRAPKTILEKCLKTLEESGKPLVVVSQKPVKTAGKNIVIGKLPRNYISMYKQIYAGLKEVKTKYVALAEHDVLYSPGYFDFIPEKDDTVYYNKNRWILHTSERIFSYRHGHALSQLVCNTELLLDIFRERLDVLEGAQIEGRMVNANGRQFKLCEPGYREEDAGFKVRKIERFKSRIPTIDICHGDNFLSKKRIWPTQRSYLDFWGESALLVRDLGLAKPIKYRYEPGFRVKTLKVDELYDNFINYADPQKAQPDNPRGTYEFQKTFRPFVKAVLDGSEYTDLELKRLPYYDYLVKHLHPGHRDPTTKRGEKHVIKKMRDAENLCKSVRDDGLQTPLDMWKYDGGRLLARGQRRVVILKALGRRKVPVRVFSNKPIYKKRKPLLDIRDNGNIERIGIRQFAKTGKKATDKYYNHNYLHLYDRHVNTPANILEIGVKDGASLLLWKKAFPKAKVSGIDIKDVSQERIMRRNKDLNLFIGDQSDVKFLKEIAKQGPFDLIVDDGSHNPDHQLITLEHLWPHVSEGGYYVIEDLWGMPEYKYKRGLIMDKLKKMIDEICLTETVSSVAFYPNICFIQKNG